MDHFCEYRLGAYITYIITIMKDFFTTPFSQEENRLKALYNFDTGMPSKITMSHKVHRKHTQGQLLQQ